MRKTPAGIGSSALFPRSLPFAKKLLCFALIVFNYFRGLRRLGKCQFLGDGWRIGEVLMEHRGHNFLSNNCSMLISWNLAECRWFAYTAPSSPIDAKGADLADMANVWVSDVMYRRCTRCLFLLRTELDIPHTSIEKLVRSYSNSFLSLLFMFYHNL